MSLRLVLVLEAVIAILTRVLFFHLVGSSWDDDVRKTNQQCKGNFGLGVHVNVGVEGRL